MMLFWWRFQLSLNLVCVALYILSQLALQTVQIQGRDPGNLEPPIPNLGQKDFSPGFERTRWASKIYAIVPAQQKQFRGNIHV